MANIEISTFTRNNDGNTYIIKDANAIPKTGSNAISGDLIPSSDGTVNLGSSSKKFASLNSIAPDELGLPTSTYTDVSSYITNFNNTPNVFTVPVSGLLFLEGDNQNSRECAIFNNTKEYVINFPYAYFNVRGSIPVEKGDSIAVYITGSLNNFSARIHHLKGKV